MSGNLENYIQFYGPDFSTNGKTNARYRMSFAVMPLISKEKGLLYVPREVEIYNHYYQRWRQHPVVFARYPDPDAYARNEGEFIIFLASGSCISLPFSSQSIDEKLYQQAERYGLHQGWLNITR